jgi:PhnB protein
MVDGAAEAIRFYAEAFGGEELFRIADPAGAILHAEVSIKGSTVMVGDGGRPFKAADAAGAPTVGIHVFVDDVDALSEQALRAGAELLQPPTDMFYGARSVILRDPFGHLWIFLTHTEDLPLDEITRRGTDLLRSAAG